MNRFFSLILSIVFVVGILISSAFGQNPLPKSIAGGVLNGKAMSLPKPVYPEAARAVKASGIVGVKVLIDETGNVVSAEAVSGHPLLRAASVEAAKEAKFSPTTLSGQPVRVTGVINYNFVLPQSTEPLAAKGLLSGVPTSDRDKLWGIGFLFAIIYSTDAETIRMIGDEQEFNSMVKDLSTDVTSDAEDYKPILEKLGSNDQSVRAQAAREFISAVHKEFNAEQNWQVDVGEQLGLLFGEMMRQKTVYVKTGVKYDANILRTYLRRISDMIAAAPQGASPELKARFQKIAVFSEAANLGTDEKFSEMAQAVAPLFEELNDN